MNQPATFITKKSKKFKNIQCLSKDKSRMFRTRSLPWDRRSETLKNNPEWADSLKAGSPTWVNYQQERLASWQISKPSKMSLKILRLKSLATETRLIPTCKRIKPSNSKSTLTVSKFLLSKTLISSLRPHSSSLLSIMINNFRSPENLTF